MKYLFQKPANILSSSIHVNMAASRTQTAVTPASVQMALAAGIVKTWLHLLMVSIS